MWIIFISLFSKGKRRWGHHLPPSKKGTALDQLPQPHPPHPPCPSPLLHLEHNQGYKQVLSPSHYHLQIGFFQVEHKWSSLFANWFAGGAKPQGSQPLSSPQKGKQLRVPKPTAKYAQYQFLFSVLIKTITKFLNMIGYHQADLSTNRLVYT